MDRISFPEQISETDEEGGFFHNAHTHLLGGIDVPFGVYEIRPRPT